MRRIALLSVCLLFVGTSQALAQSDESTPEERLLRARWPVALAAALEANGLTVVNAAGVTVKAGDPAGVKVTGDAAAVRALYEDAFKRLIDDPNMLPIYIAPLVAEIPQEKGAKSASANLTNAAAPRGAERSGFTDLISLALDAQNFVAADKSAVTINLNAVALVGLNDESLTAPEAYRKYEGLRRVGGSFTFGAKIPEKEITGLSGVPSADTLFDAVGWDVKFRVYGDRDPRAKRWHDLMQGEMGGLVMVMPMLLGMAPREDLSTLQQVLQGHLGTRLKEVKTLLESSAQVTVKAGGQHLTTVSGKNKYTFAVLADKGFGDTDLTANVAYAVVDDVTVAPGTVVGLKTWSGAVGVKHLTGKGLIVPGRAIELSLDGGFEIPDDSDPLPKKREKMWRVVGAVALPWGDAASIPVSITYSSDPNSLTKEKYFTGHIGVSYDFGALKSLFKTGDGS